MELKLERGVTHDERTSVKGGPEKGLRRFHTRRREEPNLRGYPQQVGADGLHRQGLNRPEEGTNS